MAKYLSGRSKRIPQTGLTSDRYQYLSVNQAEPNLGDPTAIGPSIPVGQQYQVISVLDNPGARYWIPVGGGLIPGSISIFDEGVVTPVGGLSSITQLNFVGAAISAKGYSNPNGSPGVAVTITVFSPGSQGQVIFNNNNDFKGASSLFYDNSTNYVGIGTTLPTQELHINGDIRLTGTIYDYNNQPGNNTNILVKNNFGGLTWVNQSTIRAGAGGTITNIQYHNNAGLVDGASNFVFDYINLRVGIGSTTPGYLLDVLGYSRFTGQTEIDYLNITGIVTASQLKVINLTTTKDLSVTGFSTFTGFIDANGGAYIDNIQIGITNDNTIDTSTGNLIINSAGGTNILTGITSVGFITARDGYFSGIVTANVFNITQTNLLNLNVTGIATIATLGVSGLTTTRNLTVIGVTTTDSLNVTNGTTTKNLKVTGIATFDNQFDINNLNVSGVATVRNIELGKIDAYTISTKSGNLILNSTAGTTQINDQLFVNDTTQSDDKDTGSIVANGGVGIEKNLNVGGQLNVAGITTLASSGGITTTGGDLYVNGNLYVNNDIFYDELFARNGYFTGIVSTRDLTVSGVATIATLGVTGLTTTRNLKVIGISTFDSYIDANGGAYIDNIQIGITNDNTIDTTTGNLTLNSTGGTTIISSNLSVTGIATFDNNVQFGNNNIDTVSFTSRISSSILPSTNGTLDLGSLNNQWSSIYANNFYGKIIGYASSIAVSEDTTGGVRYLPFVDVTAGLTTIRTNSLLTYVPSSGNLGIGSTNPRKALDVKGGNGSLQIGEVYPSYNGITLNNSNTSSEYNFLSSPADTTLFINRPTGKSILFLSNNSVQMDLRASGNLLIGSLTETSSQRLQVTGGAYISDNVGIGTTLPKAKLDVNGAVIVSAGATFGGNILPSSPDVFDIGSSTLKWSNVYANNFYGKIIGYASSIAVSEDTTGGVRYLPFVDVTSGLTTVRTNSTLVYNPSTGNLGIGATNPGEKLQVDGNIRVGSSITSNYIAFRGTLLDGVDVNGQDQTVTVGRYSHTYIGERLYVPGVEKSELLLFKGNDPANIFGNGPDRIRLAAGEIRFDTLGIGTAGTFEQVGISTHLITRMVLTSDGNLGIGTTSPRAILDVNGAVIVSAGATFGGNILPSSPDTYNLGSDPFKWNNVYANNFIGKIIGYASSIAVSEDTTGGVRYLPFVDVTSGLSTVRTNSTLVYNPSTGNLGIGTTNPTSNLYVVGTANITGNAAVNSLNIKTTGISDGDLGASGGSDSIFGVYNTSIGGTINFNVKNSGGNYNTILSLNSSAATFGGNILPSTTSSYNIGSNDLKWKDFYVDRIIGNLIGAASSISVSADSTNAIRYLTFADTTSGITSVRTNSTLTYNPSGIGSVGIATTNPKATLDVGNGNMRVSYGDIVVNGTLFLANTRTNGGGFWSNGGSDGNININNTTPGGAIGLSVKLPGGTSGTIDLPQGTGSTYTVLNATYDSALSVGIVSTFGHILPSTNNLYNLGSPSLKWNNFYVNTITGTVTGNADTATRLATPREIDISGDVIGVGIGTTFDGSQNVTIPTVLSTTGVTAGTYGSSTQVGIVTVDSKGRITSASNVNINFSTASVSKADAATQLSPRSSSPYNTIDAQGSYIHWNRTNGDGSTWLINQKGAGGGGFLFAESTSSASNVNGGIVGLTTTLKLDSSGNITGYGLLTIPSIKPTAIQDTSGGTGSPNYVLTANGSGGWSWQSVTGGGSPAISGITIKEESTTVGTSITTINFIGGSVTATSPTTGTADITITAASNVTVNQVNYTCTNPITVSGGSSISISTVSNAYGTRYIQPTQPISACDGDIWYDTSGSRTGTFVYSLTSSPIQHVSGYTTTNLVANITPSSVSSIVLVQALIPTLLYGGTSGTIGLKYQLRRTVGGSTTILTTIPFVFNAPLSTLVYNFTAPIQFVDVVNTTSPVTYEVFGRPYTDNTASILTYSSAAIDINFNLNSRGAPAAGEVSGPVSYILAREVN